LNSCVNAIEKQGSKVVRQGSYALSVHHRQKLIFRSRLQNVEGSSLNLLKVRCFSSGNVKFNSRQEEQREGDEKNDEKEFSTMTYSQKGRLLLNRYGYVFVPTYASVYVATLASLYMGIDSGWIDPTIFLNEGEQAAEAVLEDEEDSIVATPAELAKIVIKFLDGYSHLRPFIPKIENNPSLVNLGVAWIGTKFTEPLRLIVTVSIVPSIARSLGYAPKKDNSK